MKRAYADTSLGQVHYMHGGKGPPLLLLHPGPRSSRFYWKLAPVLARDFTVYAPDTLGFGASDPAPDDVTLPMLAGTMAEFLTAVGVQKAHVFGLHTGNKIGACMGVRHADRIDKLMLCGMTHSLVVETQKRNAEIHKIVGYFTDRATAADDRRMLLDWANGFRELSSEWWRQDLLERKELGALRFGHMQNRVADILLCRDSMAASRRAIMALDFAEELRQLQIPALVVELVSKGEEHLGHQGPRLVEMMKMGSLVTIENADRDLLEFEPERIAEIIVRHING